VQLSPIRLQLESGLVRGNRLHRLPAAQQDGGKIAVRLGIVRRNLKRPSVGRRCLIELTHLSKRIAEVRQRFRILGRKRDGSTERLARRLISAACVQHNTKTVVKLRRLGPSGDCLLDQRDGFVAIALAPGDQAKDMQRVGLARLHLQNAPTPIRGLAQSARTIVRGGVAQILGN
jgi:hypothetical protein